MSRPRRLFLKNQKSRSKKCNTFICLAVCSSSAGLPWFVHCTANQETGKWSTMSNKADLWEEIHSFILPTWAMEEPWLRYLHQTWFVALSLHSLSILAVFVAFPSRMSLSFPLSSSLAFQTWAQVASYPHAIEHNAEICSVHSSYDMWNSPSIALVQVRCRARDCG